MQARAVMSDFSVIQNILVASRNLTPKKTPTHCAHIQVNIGKFALDMAISRLLKPLYILCEYKLHFVLSKTATFNAISIICIGRNQNVHGASSLSLQNPLKDLANHLLDC